MIDEPEAAAAAKLCAACEHQPSSKGVCVFCGALQPDDPTQQWEPPVRRRRHRDVEDPRVLTHTPITGDMTSIDAANVFVFLMSMCTGMALRSLGERQVRGEFESIIEQVRSQFEVPP